MLCGRVWLSLWVVGGEVGLRVLFGRLFPLDHAQSFWVVGSGSESIWCL